MNSDIISSLFLFDLDEALQKIFLHLDPKSLKSCRLVNKQWNDFILSRLWRSPRGKMLLKERVFDNFFNEDPWLETINVGREVPIADNTTNWTLGLTNLLKAIFFTVCCIHGNQFSVLDPRHCM